MAHSRNIRSMHVQACQTSDLSFNMPGIIAAQNFDQSSRTGPACLGGRVTAFDLPGQIYAKLGDLASGDPARLRYNSREIKGLLAPTAAAPYLFMLRNESLGASLDQAIEQRAAAFLDKYKYTTQIMGVFQLFLPEVVKQLKDLSKDLDDRFNEVIAKLGIEHITGARLTKSITKTPVMMMASSTYAGGTELNGNAVIHVKDKDNGDVLQSQHTQGNTASVPYVRDRGDGKFKLPKLPTSATDPDEIVTQSTTSESVVHPILDTTLAHRQNKIAVLKDQIQNGSLLEKLPSMALSLSAELAALDQGIRTLQLNYVHTFLTPPIDGLITAIYKDVGESVEPGEPVMRVENDATVMFVGKIQFRGALWPGRPVQIELASIFEDEGNNVTLNGKILSIRGHSADNDEWDIIAEAPNPIVSGRRLLPINYHLDPETDSVTFP